MKLFRLPDKAVLASQLGEYPLLNAILRMLLYERMFRFALLGLLLLTFGTILFVLKIWTASPHGFVPVINLSGLDHVQAWSLQRAAKKQMAQGDFDRALYSWRGAVANNPADPELLRGALAHLLHGADRKKHAPVAVGLSRWLMRLTQTNRADLELSARLYQHFGLGDLTIQSLKPIEKQLTPSMETVYLKALFERGHYAHFAARWEDVQRRGMQLPDPDLPLYQAAYRAGWGSLDEAAGGRAQLDAGKADPTRRTLAHRLQLKVSEKLIEPERYRESLQKLQDWRQDRLEDHTRYWQVLAAVGRKAEALRLIDSHVMPPTSGDETVLLAKACYELGQQEKSALILKHYAPQFSDSEAVWVSYANLLLDQKRWKDLTAVALLIRSEDNPLRDALTAYSYYVEGLGELGQERRTSAAAAFRKITTAKLRNPVWELSVAEKLENLGFADVAKELLLDIRKDYPNDGRFWLLLAKTAFDLKDPDLLVAALSSAYKLRPDDPSVAHDYAAALIATRQRPDEALRLTGLILAKAPRAASPMINHALALLQNKRLADAEAVLERIDAGKLREAELTSYHLARFELYLGRGQFEKAEQESQLISAQYLLPAEKEWLEKARQELRIEG